MANQDDLAIGIDVGGTNTVFGIVDRDGLILHRGSIKTNKHPEVHTYIDELFLALLPNIEYAGGISRIKGIGMGAPNGNYYTGLIELAPNLPWHGTIPMAALMQDKFSLPVTLTNDANAAAIGEMTYGAAKEMKDFIMITLGTGVGSGIVANGKIIYGHDGYAGELGHCIIIPNGRYHPNTGLYGSLEMYASASGVTKTVQEMIRENPDAHTMLHAYPIEELTSKIVYECAVKGDKMCRDVFAYTGKILGMALANFAMATSPEAIILFGGLTQAGDLLFVPVRQSFEENILPLFRNKIKIIPSRLNGDDAAILGASALVWNRED